MKVVIFAGGLGARICEETSTRPKPMHIASLWNGSRSTLGR